MRVRPAFRSAVETVDREQPSCLAISTAPTPFLNISIAASSYFPMRCSLHARFRLARDVSCIGHTVEFSNNILAWRPTLHARIEHVKSGERIVCELRFCRVSAVPVTCGCGYRSAVLRPTPPRKSGEQQFGPRG